jgi:hypothetical protein
MIESKNIFVDLADIFERACESYKINVIKSFTYYFYYRYDVKINDKQVYYTKKSFSETQLLLKKPFEEIYKIGTNICNILCDDIINEICSYIGYPKNHLYNSNHNYIDDLYYNFEYDDSEINTTDMNFDKYNLKDDLEDNYNQINYINDDYDDYDDNDYDKYSGYDEYGDFYPGYDY